MKLRNKTCFFAVTLFVLVMAVSCATGPLTISYDLSPPELIQRGQEASHRNRFAHALQYYEALLERFPFDTDYVLAAEYEIAFIHYRQRRFDMARTGFNNILERYDHPDAELLPPQFRVLSLIVLARIDEAESSRRRR